MKTLTLFFAYGNDTLVRVAWDSSGSYYALAHAGAKPDAFQRGWKKACFLDHGGAKASSWWY